jgi:hypothetical protein
VLSGYLIDLLAAVLCVNLLQASPPSRATPNSNKICMTSPRDPNQLDVSKDESLLRLERCLRLRFKNQIERRPASRDENG